MDNEEIPQKTEVVHPNWFASMVKCSEATGVSVSDLRRAKKLKAPGFEERDRVNWQRLAPWLRENQDKLPAPLTDKDRKLAAEADMAEMKRDEMKGNTISLTDAKADRNQLAASLSVILKARFIQEAPSKQVGMKVIDIELANTNYINEVMALLKEKPMGEWK